MMDELVDDIAEYNNSANAIGFSVYYYISEMYSKPGLRLLAVDGVTPSNHTIADQSYPLCNEFYAAIRQDSAADSPGARSTSGSLHRRGPLHCALPAMWRSNKFLTVCSVCLTSLRIFATMKKKFGYFPHDF